MKAAPLLNLLTILEPTLCLAVLASMTYRRQWRSYRFTALFLCARLLGLALCIPILHMAGRQLSVTAAYQAYFWVYWISYGVEAILAYLAVFEIYTNAMAPLEGLRVLGTLMFRWAASISFVLAAGLAFTPRATGHSVAVEVCSRLQQTQSVLTICLLVFVIFAIRPMGLSYTSRVFGVSLGLAVFGFADLLSATWISYGASMFSGMSVFNGIAVVVALLIWTVYFALPEPKRRMIILPTTSPFLRWNQISLALGDSPGYVAIAGFPPENLTLAEIEIMKRASSNNVETIRLAIHPSIR